MLPPDGSRRGSGPSIIAWRVYTPHRCRKRKTRDRMREPPGQFWFALCSASFEVVQFATFVALEVMMMLFACHFVARGVAGDFDRLQPSFLNQRLDVSVHRGNPNAWVVLLCQPENFFRRQRPIGFCKSLSNRSLLSGISNVPDPQSNLLFAD